MSKSYSIAALAILAAGSSVAAQDSTISNPHDSTSRKWAIGSVQFRAGTMQLGLASLNADLVRNGRPTFATTVSSFGMGGYMRGGRFIIGTTTEMIFPQLRESADVRTHLSGNSTTLDAGFAIVDRRKTLIYPVASVGLRQTKLRIDQDAAFDYGDGLRDPWRSLEISSYSGVAGLGIAAEQRTTVIRGWPLSVGVQAGIDRPFGGGVAYSGDHAVTGVPRQRSGRYLRLTFGTPIHRRAEAFSAMSGSIMGLAR